MMEKTECDLCKAKIIKRYRQGLYFNKILYEDNNFIVIPAIGPISVGHIMILPKLHVPSIACLNHLEIIRVRELINFIRNKYVILSEKVVVFENASSLDDLGSSCMQHAHINVLPYQRDIPFGLMKNLFEQRVLGHSMVELPKDRPYIYWDCLENISIYESTGIHPQFIRKQLLANLGNMKWDWTVHQREDVIKDTIDTWSKLSGEINA